VSNIPLLAVPSPWLLRACLLRKYELHFDRALNCLLSPISAPCVMCCAAVLPARNSVCSGDDDDYVIAGSSHRSYARPHYNFERQPLLTQQPYAHWPVVIAVHILRNDDLGRLALLLRVWASVDWSRGRRYWGYVEDVSCDVFVELEPTRLFICTLWPAATSRVHRWPAAVSVSWLGSRGGLLQSAYVSRLRTLPLLLQCEPGLFSCSGTALVDPVTADNTSLPAFYPPWGIESLVSAAQNASASRGMSAFPDGSGLQVTLRVSDLFNPVVGFVAPDSADPPPLVPDNDMANCTFSLSAGLTCSLRVTGAATQPAFTVADAYLHMSGSETAHWLGSVYVAHIEQVAVSPPRPPGAYVAVRQGDTLTLSGPALQLLVRQPGSYIALAAVNATSGQMSQSSRCTLPGDASVTLDVACAVADRYPPSAMLLLQIYAGAALATNAFPLQYAPPVTYEGSPDLPLHVVPGGPRRVHFAVVHAGELPPDLLAISIGDYSCPAPLWLSGSLLACDLDTGTLASSFVSSADVEASVWPIAISIRGLAVPAAGLWLPASVLRPNVTLTAASSAVAEGELLSASVYGLAPSRPLTDSHVANMVALIEGLALVSSEWRSLSAVPNVTALRPATAVPFLPSACQLSQTPSTKLEPASLQVVCVVPHTPSSGAYHLAVLLQDYDGVALLSSETVLVQPTEQLSVAWSLGDDANSTAQHGTSALFAGALPSWVDGRGSALIHPVSPTPSLTARLLRGIETEPAPSKVVCQLSAQQFGAQASSGGVVSVILPGGSTSVVVSQRTADGTSLGVSLQLMGLAGVRLNSTVRLTASCSVPTLNSAQVAEASLLVRIGVPVAAWVDSRVSDFSVGIAVPEIIAPPAVGLAVQLRQCFYRDDADAATQLWACGPLVAPLPVGGGHALPTLNLAVTGQRSGGCNGTINSASSAVSAGACGSMTSSGGTGAIASASVDVLGSNASVSLAASDVLALENSSTALPSLTAAATPGSCVQLGLQLVWFDGSVPAGDLTTVLADVITSAFRLAAVVPVLEGDDLLTAGLLYGASSPGQLQVRFETRGAVSFEVPATCVLQATAQPLGLPMQLGGDASRSVANISQLLPFPALSLRLVHENSVAISSIAAVEFVAQCSFGEFSLPSSAPLAVPMIHLLLRPAAQTAAGPLLLPLSAGSAHATLPFPSLQLFANSGGTAAPAPPAVFERTLGRVLCSAQIAGESLLRLNDSSLARLSSDRSKQPYLELKGAPDAPMIVDGFGRVSAEWPAGSVWVQGEPNLQGLAVFTCSVPAGLALPGEGAVIPSFSVAVATSVVVPELASPPPVNVTGGIPFVIGYRILTAGEDAGSLTPADAGVVSSALPPVVCGLQLQPDCPADATFTGDRSTFADASASGNGWVELRPTIAVPSLLVSQQTRCSLALSCAVGAEAVSAAAVLVYVQALAVDIAKGYGQATDMPETALASTAAVPFAQQLCVRLRGFVDGPANGAVSCSLSAPASSGVSIAASSGAMAALDGDPMFCWTDVALQEVSAEDASLAADTAWLRAACGPVVGGFANASATTAAGAEFLPLAEATATVQLARASLAYLEPAGARKGDDGALQVFRGSSVQLRYSLTFSAELGLAQLAALPRLSCSLSLVAGASLLTQAEPLQLLQSAVVVSAGRPAAGGLNNTEPHAAMDVTAVFSGGEEPGSAGEAVLYCYLDGSFVEAFATAPPIMVRVSQLPISPVALAPSAAWVWPSAATSPLQLPQPSSPTLQLLAGPGGADLATGVVCVVAAQTSDSGRNESGADAALASVHSVPSQGYGWPFASQLFSLSPLALSAAWNSTVLLQARCSNPLTGASAPLLTWQVRTPHVSLSWLCGGVPCSSSPLPATAFIQQPLAFDVALLIDTGADADAAARLATSAAVASAVRCVATVFPVPRAVSGDIADIATATTGGWGSNATAALLVHFSALAFAVSAGATATVTVMCSVGGLAVSELLSASVAVHGCGPGLRVVGASHDDCDSCPAGTWPAAPGWSATGGGTARNGSAAMECRACPRPGLRCGAAGGSGPSVALEPGYFLLASSIAFVSAVPGDAATEGAAQRAVGGSLGIPGRLAELGEEVFDLRFGPCLPPGACTAAAAANGAPAVGPPSTCVVGRTGPFCGACDRAAGFGASGGDCVRCPGAAGAWALCCLTLLASALVLLACWLPRASATSAPRNGRFGGNTRLWCRISSRIGALAAAHESTVFAVARHCSSLAQIAAISPPWPAYAAALGGVSIVAAPASLAAVFESAALQCALGWSLPAQAWIACALAVTCAVSAVAASRNPIFVGGPVSAEGGACLVAAAGGADTAGVAAGDRLACVAPPHADAPSASAFSTSNPLSGTARRLSAVQPRTKAATAHAASPCCQHTPAFLSTPPACGTVERRLSTIYREDQAVEAQTTTAPPGPTPPDHLAACRSAQKLQAPLSPNSTARWIQILLLLLFPAVATLAARLLTCTQPVGSTRYLAADVTVICGSTSHLAAATACCLCTVVLACATLFGCAAATGLARLAEGPRWRPGARLQAALVAAVCSGTLTSIPVENHRSGLSPRRCFAIACVAYASLRPLWLGALVTLAAKSVATAPAVLLQQCLALAAAAMLLVTEALCSLTVRLLENGHRASSVAAVQSADSVAASTTGSRLNLPVYSELCLVSAAILQILLVTSGGQSTPPADPAVLAALRACPIICPALFLGLAAAAARRERFGYAQTALFTTLDGNPRMQLQVSRMKL
jgi:hypothetical protein